MNTDLTVGKPSSVLLRFTIPMLLSVMFQQFYNVADSIVAGQYIGVNALAAVGASYPITMIFMAIANGSNIGASVIISQLFGGKRLTKMKTAINTSVISSLALSSILTVLGLIFTKPLLKLLGTPEAIMADSAIYLYIYIGGLFFLFLYNICTAVFTALGDSRTPLYFLICSSIGNIFLDILFVTKFNMGVSGVAWATFIAQGISSILSTIVLIKRVKKIDCEKPKIYSVSMLKRISKIAIPSILQQSFVSVGNLFIQGLINSYGSVVVASFAASMKLNTFTITTLSTLGNGLSSYTAQNMGAGNLKRVKKGFNAGVILAIIVVLPFFIAFFFAPQYMMRIFVSKESADVIASGVTFLRIVSPFYFLITVKLIVDGILRGSGAMITFMTSTFSDLILRVAFAFILSPLLGEIGIWISWPIGWTVASIISMVFYFTGTWKKNRIHS